MADQITYTDKVAIISNPNPEINKVTDANMNEIKAVVNANADELDTATTDIATINTALGGKVNDTGNETIAGVKTFSSDPLIPDEAYGSGWNGVLEPPTKNAVYDKIESLDGEKLDTENSASALTDGASITLTAAKHTLATDEATITFSISYTGDDIVIEVTLTGTSAIYTFPSGSLCVAEGLATGDNDLSITGASGDKYIIAIKKIGSVYYVVSKNFGQ